MDWTLEKQPPARRQVWTVSALTARIKGALEEALPQVWVEGEVSGAKPHSSGHLYFTLKDGGAQISCAMWRSYTRHLKMRLTDGQQVLVKGTLDVYAPRGTYTLIAEAIEPRGVGDLQVAFEQLKRRLAAEGLFDAGRKRPLPQIPRRIGIVTSPTGAAIRDVLSVLARRFPLVEIVVAPARVQGEGAAAEVVAALTRLAQLPEASAVDVVLVTRGGGSLEDLWTFNEEAVARAIVACPLPVMSAVGHEVDVTIADLVADVRAPTPSAAAELLVPDAASIRPWLDGQVERMVGLLMRRMGSSRTHVMGLTARLVDPRRTLASQRRRVAELSGRLERAAARRIEAGRLRYRPLVARLERGSPQARLGRDRERLALVGGRLAELAGRTTAARRDRLGALVGRLEALSPLGVLARGYALATRARDGALVKTSADVGVGEGIRVRLGAGAVTAVVDGVEG